MEITSELIKTIYDRAKQYAFAKYGKEPDAVHIDNIGNIIAFYWGHDRGDEEYYEFSASCLTEDLEIVLAKRKEEERIAAEKQAEYNRQRKIVMDKIAKDERYKQYLKLKEEFGNEF